MYIIDNTNYNVGTTDNGINGKIFEMEIKNFFGCKSVVSKPTKKDLFKYVDSKKASFEIKTASGEIERKDANGKVTTSIVNSTYVIYRATLTSPIFVLKSVDFYNLLKDNNLLRVKVSTEMARRKKNGETWWYDVVSIVTIDDKTSHKKRDFINTLLSENALTLNEFITSHEIKTA